MRSRLAATASLADVADFVSSMDPGFLRCRDWSHAWDPRTSTVQVSGAELIESLSCQNCDTVRTRAICRMTGTILRNRYLYPEGYAAKGIGRIGQQGRGVFRLESYRRRGARV
jgi:hypothetical protein